MICMSCTPPLCDAGRRPSTLAGRIGGGIRRTWRTYWDRRARQATVLMLRALGEHRLRDIGIDPGEIECLLEKGGARCPRR
jgi:uncharacterized protein YjiS (DUF1127 family)